jgi:hypothetical protein
LQDDITRTIAPATIHTSLGHQLCRQLVGLTAARDLGWVTAILYSWLATSLRSVVIILPIHLYLLSLASTFATIFPSLPYIYLSGRMLAYLPLH